MSLTTEQINNLLAQADNKSTQGASKMEVGFSPAANHLLHLNYVNLFEPQTGNQEWWFRCKGCDSVVKRTKREDHFLSHKRKYNG